MDPDWHFSSYLCVESQEKNAAADKNPQDAKLSPQELAKKKEDARVKQREDDKEAKKKAEEERELAYAQALEHAKVIA